MEFLRSTARWLWQEAILGGTLSRLVLGGIFIYASIDKIAHPDQFAEAVNNYKILPAMVINVFAIALPWLEAIAGLFLVLGIWPKESAAILGALLLVFIVAIGFNLARGLDFYCGCFSSAETSKNSSIWLLVRDIMLLAPAIQLLWFVPGRESRVGSPAGVQPESVAR